MSIGIAYSTADAIAFTVGSVTIKLSGLAVGALVGILYAVMPCTDYEFGVNPTGDTAVDFKVI